MTVGLMVVTLMVEGASSLKDKRMVLSSIKDRVRQRFNVSILESDHQDLWQKAELSFVLLAATQQQAEQQLDSIERFVFEQYPGRHISSQRDYFGSLDK